MANSNKDEELRLLYQVSIDDIRFSKQQQWNTIYLTLIAIGAILALFLGLESNPVLKKVLCQRFLPDFLPWKNINISLRGFLAYSCIIIAGLGIFYICQYQKDLAAYRFNKRLLMANFTSKKAKRIVRKEPKNGKTFGGSLFHFRL